MVVVILSVRSPLRRLHPLLDALLVVALVVKLPLERVRQDLEPLPEQLELGLRVLELSFRALALARAYSPLVRVPLQRLHLVPAPSEGREGGSEGWKRGNSGGLRHPTIEA